jgi:hypothetical protein
MDYTSPDENGFEETPKPRQLPADLPRSLNDRRHTPAPQQETEFWDEWQGTTFRMSL